jgi:steroid delta-isomerase-like uncharacterized protein
MAELQKKAISAYLAAFNAHDAKKTAELYKADAVSAMPGPTGLEETRGREAIEKMHAAYYSAFPDIKVGFVRVFQKGDVLVQQWVAAGTHKGDFMGMKATNKPAGVSGATVTWVDADGLIKRQHVYWDQATVGVQVGASKGKARPVATVPAGEGEWIVAKGSPEEDKAVESVKAFYGVFEKKDEKGYLAMMTEESTHSSLYMPQDTKGLKAAKDQFATLTKAFPDIKITATSAWGFGNFVITESVLKGTQKGALPGGIKATNKPVELHALDVLQLKDGKLAAGWTYASNLEMMGQLGLLPKPAEAKDAPKAAAKPTDAKPAPAKAPDAKPADKAAAKPADKGATKPADAKPATPAVKGDQKPTAPATAPKK